MPWVQRQDAREQVHYAPNVRATFNNMPAGVFERRSSPPYVAMILNIMIRYRDPPCFEADTAHMTAQNSMYAMRSARSIAETLYFHRDLFPTRTARQSHRVLRPSNLEKDLRPWLIPHGKQETADHQGCHGVLYARELQVTPYGCRHT